MLEHSAACSSPRERASSRGQTGGWGHSGPCARVLLWALEPWLGVGTFSISALFSRAHRALITVPAPEGWARTNLKVSVAQSCPALCDPVDCSLPGSPVHGILQARVVERVAIPFSRESSQPRDQTHVSCSSCIAGGFFTGEPPGKPLYSPTFSNPLRVLLCF